MNKSRRIFMLDAIGVSLAASLLPQFVYAASMLSETDRDALALGYRADSSKVDVEKYPKYVSGQHCGNCSWYQGRGGEAVAACSLYGNDKYVSANGWCTGWMKKG